MGKRMTVGVAGLGLIGGSIAKALKRTGKGYEIAAWDYCADSICRAQTEEVIQVPVSSDFHEFSDCRIVFICVPVHAFRDVIAKLKPVIRSDCLITDVASTKGDVERIIRDMGLEHQYAGGHPLAGSELSGYQASKANLFENAYYVITENPLCQVDTALLKEIIQDIGAIPLVMDAEQHDRATAVISHVPHVVASLLVNLVDKLDGPEGYMKTLAAGGFKDITRIASSSPELWTGISMTNQRAILATLQELRTILAGFESNLAQLNEEPIKDFFARARSLRSTFSDKNKGILQKTYDIVVDVEDKPGIIAIISTALAAQGINIKNIGIINNRENDEGALEIRFENEDAMNRGMSTLKGLGYEAKARI